MQNSWPLANNHILASDFISHPNYLAQNLQFLPFDKIRTQLEHKLERTLLHRGEAHITVLSPPEWEILTSHLRPTHIEEIAQIFKIQQMPFEVLCVGSYSSPDKGATYFLVINSPHLFDLRTRIHRAFTQLGGNPDKFDPTHYFPHITLGFDVKDFHHADGAIKDSSSCVYTHPSDLERP